MSKQPAFSGLPHMFVPRVLLTVDCGKCGSMSYQLKVLPQDGKARLVYVQCVGCGNRLDIDEHRMIEGKGKKSFSPIIQPIGAKSHG